MSKTIDSLGIVLFNGFETLDVMGPVEVFGRLLHCKITFMSPDGGKKESSQRVLLETQSIDKPQFDHILIPGGKGTRALASEKDYLSWLKEQADYAKLCMTVCTGSALLAKTGLLDGIRATSNKMAFHWVVSQNEQVQWQRCARWVKDGKFYTSSGISAGIDMSLEIINEMYGYEKAKNIANEMEYIWNEDSNNDPFYLKNES